MKLNNTKLKSISTLILLNVSILGFSQISPSQYFEDTKGNIDINESGQLQFTLPIALPPAVKGVAPQVSLVYNNGGSNGLAGYGWNIAGLSSISRTGKNLEKDGEMKSIQLDYTDYYNFNGQRLILKSGEYGKSGAEYVTEKYSNTKIKSLGSISGQAWQGPEYWEVTFADGSQAWYGAIASGTSSARTPLEYNIVKWKDAKGNYISYNYAQATGANVSVISSIKWGGNETLGKVHFNEIVFNYNTNTTREFIEQSYVNGISLLQDKLLNNIIVKSNSSQYKKYDIIYKTDATKYQNVDKIQEYNAQNETSNPIEFFKNENTSGGSVSDGSWSGLKDLILTGDFRGTHSSDFIIYKEAEAGNPAGYYLHYGDSLPKYYLGTENVFKGAVPINIKEANGIVSSRQGFVSYSVNTTTKDLTLSYYLIDLTKTYNSQTTPNALSLVGTKIIAHNQWDESNSDLTDPNNTYVTKTTIKKLIPYDYDGDGVPEILIEKNNNTVNTWCTNQTMKSNTEKVAPPTGTNCETYTFDASNYIVIKQQDNSFPFLGFSLDKSENLVFGDFNGDGVSDIGRSLISTNTTIEGESVPSNLLKAYNLKIEAQGTINLNEVYSASYSGLSSELQTADFNGDGISDLFVRTNINNHYVINLNTGKSFLKIPYYNDFNGTENNTGDKNGNYSTAKVLDINADGKSDIINFSSSYNIASSTSASSSFTIRVSDNQGYQNGKILFGSGQATTNNYNYPWIYREVLGFKQNTLHVYRPSSQNAGGINSFSYYSNLQEKPINKIVQGGITTLIYYNGLDSNIGSYYKSTKNELYPLMELENVNSNLVSMLVEGTSKSQRVKKFRYRGLLTNLHNKKILGYRQMASSSWYASGFENTIIWSGVETDPLKEGFPIKEWTIRTNDESKIFPADISENNSQLLSFKTTTYQIDKILNGQVVATIPDTEKAKVVTVILPKTSKAKDFLTGSIAETTTTYGDYYLPSQNVSAINTSLAQTTSTYLYDNNASGTGSNYYIGRLKTTTELVQAYGDTKSGKEEFTYENNLIKTIKKWNRDNTDYTLDTFTYDGFGNITQKISSNSMDSQTITSGYQYDAKGRFVIQQTDNMGLLTETVYNDWGQVLTQTDPLGNILTNIYDSWGKLLSSTTSLGGVTSYQYDRDSSYNNTVIQNEPDGNISKTFTNVWGQVYKASTKAFGQGQFISQETQYDALGRKIKESEPYFEGQSASQWNIIAYDDTVYPAKLTATAFNGKKSETTVSGLVTTEKELTGYGRITSKTNDALGNLISSSDKGGTITFSYNAAGEQIQAKYDTNIVTTKYDVWGRKSEFNDPSNGVYTYEYDGFGRTKKTISPKGKKEYTYNNFGQLISQNEISTIDAGQTTNKSISFTYNNKGLLTAKSGTANGQSYSFSFNYDAQGRLLAALENSNGKIYAQKSIIYDDKGRITSYEKALQSSGTLTNVAIENVYSTWSGELYQIKDKKSGKILWELKETNTKGQVLKAKLGAADVNNTYDANGFLTNVNHSSSVKPSILQLSYSFDAIKNELKSRTTGGDFNIAESFDYDDNNRLINWTNPITGVKPTSNRNVYDIKGRITQNDQVGTIKFENSAKVYQPTGMTLNTAGTQNYNNDLIQSITYNENNDPVFIDGQKGDVVFQYGLTGMRQKVSYGGNFDPTLDGKFTKFYSEDGSFEVVRNNTTGQEKYVIYIGGSPYESNIVYLKDFTEKSSGSYKFLHKDYLGSILAISDEAGNKLEQRHFDAWGNFTHLQIGNGAIVTDKDIINNSSLLLERGYTSHEHFTEVGIIHMNGRLYDPLLRRFLNADENIQDPANTQNYNKYGYVMNNPLIYNDPNGEFWWWAAGALVGSYFGGVQANNGNMNPFKWDWKNTWGAVVGGGFAGAAIGGAIQNISMNATKFVANSIVGSVGGIFNGLANGQNIFKSALTGFSGINYSFNLSGIASTDLISSDYKYIISPEEDYSGGGWEDLTKGILLNYVKTNFCETCSMGALQQKAGKMFEAAFNSIMSLDNASFNYTSNNAKIAGMYKNRPRNTIPDGIFDLVRDEVEYRKDNFKVGPFNIKIPIPTGTNTLRYRGVQFAEVKAMDGTLYSGSNQGQISAMLWSMRNNRGVNQYGGQFLIGTTSDTVISPSIIGLGASYRINVTQMTSQYRMISGDMQVRFSYGFGRVTLNTAYIK